jgi:hypothetical protein
MPQNANAATIATNPSGKQVALQTDANGLLKVTTQEVNTDPKSVFNITAATVVKAVAGRVLELNVIVAGSATGTVNDCATTGAAAVTNQAAVTPTTIGPVLGVVDWPFQTGIVIVPGTGQTLAVAYV